MNRWLIALAVFAACAEKAEAPPALPDAGVVTATATAVREPSPAEKLEQEGLRYVQVVIKSNLESSLAPVAEPELAAALAQVVNRTLVWWADPATDLRTGDIVEAVYRPRPGEEPEALAVWFKSLKHGKAFSAVRYQAEGGAYARWYTPDGEELELRLVEGPIQDYEQVTSLVGDGRRHKGVDFKAAQGTPVTSPFDGIVERKNWAMRGNGMSVDIHLAKGGVNAYFLHLSEISPKVKVGARVRKGEVIGKSGNTGRSTAPHLHYQLVRGKKVLDPFRYHQTHRAKLAEGEIPRLAAAEARLSVLRKPHDAARDL
ncbi:MAG: M23 family metallopeptidase [Deltaproteobacteria bacterium]|nr:M23 family metallopeptidase [Deltaproteobacteria bacterium]